MPHTPLLEDRTKPLIYVIGDPQGNLDLLDLLLYRIESGLSFGAPLASNDMIVVMGNFLDSEDETQKDIIDLLRDYKKAMPDNFRILRGQTEQRMVLNRKSLFKLPVGKSLMRSYRGLNRHYLNNPERLEAKTFVEDMRWLAGNTEKFVETNKFFMCSGSVDPDRPIGEQWVDAMMYKRKKFIESNRVYPKKIVHGLHTTKKIEIKSNRLNVNTSVKTSGVLSCVILNDRTGAVEGVDQVDSVKKMEKTG